MNPSAESVVLGGGCFWCLEAVFRRVRGVVSVEVGYAGGYKENPTYEEVSSGITGHAEVVKVNYDPAILALEDILKVFFFIHDPTSCDKQGNDIGHQYRSIIFFKNDRERMAIGFFIAQIVGLYKKSIITEVVPLREFYSAEDYHKNYFEKHPKNSYCRLVIAPKLEEFKNAFEKLYVKPE